jgi:hypothetical protein
LLILIEAMASSIILVRRIAYLLERYGAIVDGQLAIKHHTIGWAFDPTQNGIKRLTIDDCKNDLKKMYIMYYNVYKKKLMPKGQVRDEFDYMKNFKNRLKVIRANMFQTTCLDGNTLDHTRQDTVIIP